MFVVRLSQARREDVEGVESRIERCGTLVRSVALGQDDFILFQSDEDVVSLEGDIGSLPGVVAFDLIETPYVLSARACRPERTTLRFDGDLVLGSEEFVVMAGPCTVETETQVRTIARSVAASGARVLRGGAFKPRTSPFSFQGRGVEGLQILRNAGKQERLLQVSEALSGDEVPDVVEAVDILQIGMRNALNYPLLDSIGRHPLRPPVLLKRGIGSTLEEFLAAADYILAGGNPNVMLCLRGTVDFSRHSRASLNVADIPALRRMTHLPILVDPSHAAGHRELVPAMSAAALVAGADGLLVEVHHEPDLAWVDGPQSLTLRGFDDLMIRLRALAPAMGRWVYQVQVGERHDAHPMEDLGLERPAKADDIGTRAGEDHEELQA